MLCGMTRAWAYRFGSLRGTGLGNAWTATSWRLNNMKPMVDLVANAEPRLTRIESGDDYEESG